MQHNIEDKIDKALHSMDHHERATPAPYLMTRIVASLATSKDPNAWDKIYAMITRPVIALACITLILIINIVIITSTDSTDTVRLQPDVNAEWQGYSAAGTRALYDVETMEP